MFAVFIFAFSLQFTSPSATLAQAPDPCVEPDRVGAVEMPAGTTVDGPDPGALPERPGRGEADPPPPGPTPFCDDASPSSGRDGRGQGSPRGAVRSGAAPVPLATQSHLLQGGSLVG